MVIPIDVELILELGYYRTGYIGWIVIRWELQEKKIVN